jgi:hypothetical protein
LPRVKARLIVQKRLLNSSYSGCDDGVDIWKKNKIVAMFALGALHARKMIDQGLRVKDMIAKGHAIGWLDCLLMTALSAADDMSGLCSTRSVR